MKGDLHLKKVVAFCGIMKDGCPAFAVVGNNDDKKCLNTDRNNFYIFCDDCVIKSCIVERGIDNCTQCVEYPCNMIK